MLLTFAENRMLITIFARAEMKKTFPMRILKEETMLAGFFLLNATLPFLSLAGSQSF